MLDLENVEEVEVFDLAKPRHRSSSHPDLPEKPGGPDNWVEKVGGLPEFIKRVAKHIFYDSPGMTVSHAIAAAIEQCKKWAAKGNAKAAAAVAQWEGKKARSHAMGESPNSLDFSLLQQTRQTVYSTYGNSVSALGTGVRGSAFSESKHPRAFGGKFGKKLNPSDLIAAKRRITGNLVNLQVGESYNLPNQVGWVKRTPGGYFIQGNGGYTASVRTLSEAIEAAAALLVQKGIKQ